MKVRDHIPLEQGLRQRRIIAHRSVRKSQRPYSIRTRIKTDLHPRQDKSSSRVRDHIPLEQGLRLYCVRPGAVNLRGQRPYSIRTRIKTHRD